MRPAGRSSQCDANGYSILSSHPGSAGSAAKLVREMDEVTRDEIPVLLGAEVLVLARALLARARHEARAEADSPRGREVVIVRGYQRDLGRLEAEEVRGAQIAFRLRLVVPRHFGAENGVPGQPRPPGHVDHEGDVAVRQGGQDVLLLHALEPGHRVGPRVESVPGAIEMVQVRLAEPLDAEIGHEL